MRRLSPLLVLILVALLAWLATRGVTDTAVERAPELTATVAAETASAESAGHDATDGTPHERSRKHAAPPPTAERPTPEPRKTTFTLRVVDGHDRPVPGVALSFSGSIERTNRVTRSDGTASWTGPADGLRLSATSALFAAIELTEPETVVRLDDLLPLEIRFVDQETREPVEVYVQGSPLETDNVLSNRLHSSFRASAAPLRGGHPADLKIWVTAADGHVLRPCHPIVRGGFVSRYATSVRTTVPVARELRLDVTVLRHDGSPAAGATAWVSVTGAYRATATESVPASGTARVPGLPFTRGERVIVHGRDDEGRLSPAETVVLHDADRDLHVTVRLPREPDPDSIGIGGGAGGAFGGRTSRRRVRSGTGRIAILATRRNGLPAAGAAVALAGPLSRDGRADDDGRVAFGDLPGGDYTVTLREPGLVSTSEKVTIVDGEERTMAVREIAGRAATVRVADAHGLPLPNVRIVIELPWGEQHVQLVDGVQDLDHWTDLTGRCQFVDLPAAAVEVRARLGSREVSGRLVGDSIDLTLPAE